jgi:hypothetical protein
MRMISKGSKETHQWTTPFIVIMGDWQSKKKDREKPKKPKKP